MSRFTWIFAVLGLLAFAAAPAVTMAEGHEGSDVAAPADEGEEAEAAPAEGEGEGEESEAGAEEGESEGGMPE